MFKQSAICTIICLATVSALIDEKDVQYYIYSHQNPDRPALHGIPLYALTTIDPLKPVKLLCHGFLDNASSFWIEPTKNAYMAKGFTNVIAVDWSKHAFGRYSNSVKEAQSIGDHIAAIIMIISETYDIDFADFHLIGHSLGAHISGYAGKKIIETTHQKVGRITALDPAGPSYNGNDINHRLSSDDAIFVDAIHTDTTLFGYTTSIAHADFWPNGGTAQNGCSLFLFNCSHCRAPMYFYESIRTSIPAWKCSSIKNFNKNICFNNEKAIMGDNCDSKTRGDFYLRTNKEAPFGILSY